MLSDDELRALASRKRKCGRKPLAEATRQQILRDMLEHDDTALAAERAGVSRTTVCRIMREVRALHGAK